MINSRIGSDIGPLIAAEGIGVVGRSFHGKREAILEAADSCHLPTTDDTIENLISRRVRPSFADRKFINVTGNQRPRNVVDHQRFFKRSVVPVPHTLRRPISPTFLAFGVGQVLGCREGNQKMQTTAETPAGR